MAGEVRLADLCDAVVDCPHSTPLWTEVGVVVLRNQNIRDGRLDLSEASYTDESHFAERTRRALPEAGDLVITREAPMGEVCMIPPGLRCCLGQRMVLLRANRKRADPRYLLYALQSKTVQYEIGVNEGTGSTVSNLRIPLLESLPIPMHPINEQRAIAHILSTLDDKIELNRRTSETLEAMARSLYSSLFVDRFESDMARLDEYADVVMGLSPTGDTYNDQALGTPLINGPVEFGEHFPVKTKWTTDPIRLCDRHDVILCVRGSTTGRYVISDDQYCLGRGVCAIRARNASRAFVRISTTTGIPRLLQKTTGSVFPSLSAPDIKAFAVPKADPELVHAFEDRAVVLFDRQDQLFEESRTLAALRDALLPKLISGELRVKDAEKFAARIA